MTTSLVGTWTSPCPHIFANGISNEMCIRDRLRGETDEYETDITDKKELQIRDAMGDILKQLPLDLSKKEDAFSKDVYKRQL